MRFEILPPVPAVTIARRLREIPLFRFVSVDELFRISSISQQVRYEKGARVQEHGQKAEYIQVLVSGRLRKAAADGAETTLEPPAMLGFQEALEGTPARESARAEDESIALVMLAEEFQTLLSANIELAQGLFRLLVADGSATLEHVRERFAFEHKEKPLSTVDKVMYLQTLPILTRATGEEIYEVAAITKELALAPGEKVAEAGDVPSILLTLTGSLERKGETGDGGDEGGGTPIPPGRSLGVRETLAGTPWSETVVAREASRVLAIERDPFFDLLGDRMELLQVIFGSVFRGGNSDGNDARGTARG